MKRFWPIALAYSVLVTAGCASTRYYPRGYSPSRMYDVTNFNGEWKVSDPGREETWFLPDYIRIDGDRATLRIEDDTGTLLDEIALDSDYRYGAFGAERNEDVRTRWITERRFEVNRSDREGRMVTETYALDPRLRRLSVEIKVTVDGGSHSSMRVYRRV